MDRTTHYEPYSQLEAALARALRQLKADLASVDVGHINFGVCAHGRTDGDINVSFRLGFSSDPDHAEGGRLAPVVGEHIRRNEWKRKNAPLCLANVPQDDPYERTYGTNDAGLIVEMPRPVDTSQDRRIDEIIDELEDEKHNG